MIQTFIRCYQPSDDESPPQPATDMTRHHLSRVTDMGPRTIDRRPSPISAGPSPIGSARDLRSPSLSPCAQIVVTALLNTSDNVRPRSATVELRPVKPVEEPPLRTRRSDEIHTAHADLNGYGHNNRSPDHRMTLMRLEATNGDVF